MSASTTAEPIRRASDIEEASNRWLIHPISSALVPMFARAGVSPNAVSILGMVCGASAAFFFARFEQGWQWSVAGLLLMLVWHVCDGADGQLARLTGKQSEFGKLIDGICDYVVFIANYVALAAVTAPMHGGWVWAMMLAAGACHAMQAGAYEVQRQLYDHWGLGKASAALPDPRAAAPKNLGERLALGYAKMQWRVSGLSFAFHDALLNASDAARSQEWRAAWREVQAPAVHRWSILCANYRSFGIFLACLLGAPLLYFLWEVLILSPIHLLLARWQRKRNHDFKHVELIP